MKEKKLNNCKFCRYAVKQYISIGDIMYLDKVSFCLRTPPSKTEKGKPFEIRTDCQHFTPEQFPAPRSAVERRIFALSKQLDEVTGIMMDVIEKFEPHDDETTE